MPDWHDVGAFDELTDDAPLIVTIADQTIGVRRWKDKVFAVINRCGHAGAPMGYGEIHPRMTSPSPGAPVVVDEDSPEIRCPWHHWGFDLATGACTAPVRRPRLRIFPTRVDDGRVYVLV
jgi:Ferredoxin subunits of nitrite reductase and ring-hydroxylating dioxygenases